MGEWSMHALRWGRWTGEVLKGVARISHAGVQEPRLQAVVRILLAAGIV
jgi:hypothetical protein